jgi:hypothetical protein
MSEEKPPARPGMIDHIEARAETGGSRVEHAYDTDFLSWTERQAGLLRRRADGDLVNDSDLDWLNLAGEIESVGASEKREVRRRLMRITQHLLKWRYQPELRSRSWQTTLHTQRRDLLALFEDSPSLRPFAEQALPSAFPQGRQAAEIETGLLHLPDQCPWTFEQIVAQDFWPEAKEP